MKNPIFILLSVGVLTAVSIGGYSLTQNTIKPDSVMKIDDTKMEKTDEQMTTSSHYVDYSPAVLEYTAQNRRVLFFFASWCPTCTAANKSLTENLAQIPADVTVIKVNYNDPETDDNEKALAKKYGITYQHTFVQIDSSGRELAKWNGGQINELLSNIKNSNL